MCGLFGFVADEDKTIDTQILRRVATNTMKRGPHSWGIAWVNPQGKLRMFKQTGRIVDDLGLLVSLATLLYCFATAQAQHDPNMQTHFGRWRWAANVFKRFFPKSFSKLDTSGAYLLEQGKPI